MYICVVEMFVSVVRPVRTNGFLLVFWTFTVCMCALHSPVCLNKAMFNSSFTV